MTIPFRATTIDLLNLLVTKGGNFLLTGLVFGIVSKSLDVADFSLFGYWWSIAVMIGGVFLGGTSSALIRTVAVAGSLRGLRHHARQLAALIALLVVAWWLVEASNFQYRMEILLTILAAGFGLTIQTQTAVLALMRAVRATRANFVASLSLLITVPIVFLALLRGGHGLPAIFTALLAAYVAGAVIAGAVATAPLRHLFNSRANDRSDQSAFVVSAAAFTAINIFSYAIVNVDFTVFRVFGTPQDFAAMATAKIFFERFVLPALLIYAGAISLTVLRHTKTPNDQLPRIEVRLDWRVMVGAIAILAMTVIGYTVFAVKIRGEITALALPWIAFAAVGYLFYVVNAVLMDVMVIRRSLTTVIANVAAFLLLTLVVQIIAIREFGVPGWGVGWLVTNALIFLILSREGLTIRRTEATIGS